MEQSSFLWARQLLLKRLLWSNLMTVKKWALHKKASFIKWAPTMALWMFTSTFNFARTKWDGQDTSHSLCADQFEVCNCVWINSVSESEPLPICPYPKITIVYWGIPLELFGIQSFYNYNNVNWDSNDRCPGWISILWFWWLVLSPH